MPAPSPASSITEQLRDDGAGECRPSVVGAFRILALLLALSSPAGAASLERELVALQPPPNARLPESASFEDAMGRRLLLAQALAGRPALVIPVDFTCRSICGPALTIASAALSETGLRPDQDFRLLVVGFDPRDSIADARAFASARIAEPEIAAATVIMRGDAESTHALLGAIGYRTAYDAQIDQFSHTAGAVLVTADGRVGRALSTLALNPRDLRLALIEAGEGRIGSIADRVTLLCSHYDPVRGIYTGAITRILQAAFCATVLLLAGSIFVLSRRHRAQRSA